MEPVVIVLGVVALGALALAAGGVYYLLFQPLRLLRAARSVGSQARFGHIVAMGLRRVPAAQILDAHVLTMTAGVGVPLQTLEAHFLAGGRVEAVVAALVTASEADLKLSFEYAAAVDLAGRDVVEAVRSSLNPRDIKTSKVFAVAADGIPLLAAGRVTVRTNIDRLVGGAGEEALLARVREGIALAIGSADSYKRMLHNPDSIARRVMDMKLDAGTAFTIDSIEITDIDLGPNTEAELQADQAAAASHVR